MRILYTISIHLYQTAIYIASLFNPKARLWINGRKNIFGKLQSQLQNPNHENSRPDSLLIWFHCASLGEFEQGRPLLEKYRKLHPSHSVLLTFFSPSGYEIRKNYAGADYVFYLPVDTAGNARKLIEIIQPQAAFFVKYEFWFNYLNELKSRNVPTYLVSGIFREDHYFFKSTGAWFRQQLGCFTHFFLQDEKSMNLLNSIGYTNTTLSGDTRFDRVVELSKNIQEIGLIKQFIGDKKVMILGSSWGEDEKLISRIQSRWLSGSDFKLIIAPHEIDEKHLSSLEAQFKINNQQLTILRYSIANEKNIDKADIIVVDNIGMLSSLYQYGTIAFIGGGFGKGIHNILEAAAFGMPVIFGPNYHKFTEAKELIKLGGAFEVKNTEELEKTMSLLADQQVLNTASRISRMYVQGRVGATDKILSKL